MVAICKCCLKQRPHCWSACGIISAAMAILFSLAFILSLADAIIFLIIKKELQLVPDSATLDDWTIPDVPIYDTYYIFNTQNPDDFSAGDVPIVKEIGPFIYRRYDKKFNVTWNADETLITFQRDIYYVFEPSKSVGDPHNYRITLLNVPLLVVLNQLNQLEHLLFKAVNETVAQEYLAVIKEQPLFIEKTAHEILWGYENPIFKMLKTAGLSGTSVFTIKSNHSTNFSEGFTTAKTGKSDIDDVAQIIQWNNLTTLPAWNSVSAREIRGTLAMRVHPKLKKTHKLTVFSDDYIRHVLFIHGGKRTLHGIDLWHYTISPNAFSNSSDYPPNEGYYAYNYKYGMLNISSIFPMNGPMYASNPNCLDCDPEYFKNVSGYHPVRNKHESFLDIEPFTGITMNAAKRSQINVRIARNESLEQLASVRDVTMYPWFYLLIEATLTEKKANDFKLQIELPRIILSLFFLISAVMSGVIAFLMAALISRWCYYHQKEKGNIKGTCDDSINHSSPLLHGDDNIINYHTEH